MQLSLSTKEILICTAVSAAWVGVSLMTGIPNFTILHIALTASFAAAQVFFSYVSAKAAWPYVQQGWQAFKQGPTWFKGKFSKTKSATNTPTVELVAQPAEVAKVSSDVVAAVAPQPKLGRIQKGLQSIRDFAQSVGSQIGAAAQWCHEKARIGWTNVKDVFANGLQRAKDALPSSLKRAAAKQPTPPVRVVEVRVPASAQPAAAKQPTPPVHVADVSAQAAKPCCGTEAKVAQAASEAAAKAEQDAAAKATQDAAAQEAAAKAEQDTAAKAAQDAVAKAAQEAAAKAEQDTAAKAAQDAVAKAAQEAAAKAEQDAAAKAAQEATVKAEQEAAAKAAQDAAAQQAAAQAVSSAPATPAAAVDIAPKVRKSRRVDQLKEGKDGNASDYSSASDREDGRPSRRRSAKAAASVEHLDALLGGQPQFSPANAPASPNARAYAPLAAATASAVQRPHREATPPVHSSRSHSHSHASSRNVLK